MNRQTRIFNSPWLSWGLLILAYATFGRLLHSSADGSLSPLMWGMTLGMVILKAGILTLVWRPVHKFVLLGFQSDWGYSIMVLVLASLAVLAVVHIRAFAYGVVLIATSLLVRVDCLVQQMSDRASFVALVLLSFIGIGVSWLPVLLQQGLRHFIAP
ncbi:MAG: hypothetical protein AAGH78_11665 [Cyanobacteria bacterium P01_H01_bin.58]